MDCENCVVQGKPKNTFARLSQLNFHAGNPAQRENIFRLVKLEFIDQIFTRSLQGIAPPISQKQAAQESENDSFSRRNLFTDFF